jgi:hypothetical protein
MNCEKLQVKFYLADGSAPELEQFIPVFHRWIREHALDELAIDVVDYRHMHRGPGVVLIGHAADYYVDQHDGRTGLMVSRKRATAGASPDLRDGFRRVLIACRLLEQETSFATPLEFGAGEALVRLPDRLRAPSSPEGYQSLERELSAFARELWTAGSVGVERVGEPGDPLGARVRAAGAEGGVASLLARLT